MKKMLMVLLLAVSIFALVGCEEGYSTGFVIDGDFQAVGDLGNYDVLRDLETGCLYLESHVSTKLSPLYGEDGKVQGCGNKEALPYISVPTE